MIRFINRITGGEMWVADDRVGEYKAAGHRLAASPEREKPAVAEKMEKLVEEIGAQKAAKKPVKRTKK
jgi:hypothetical protein